MYLFAEIVGFTNGMWLKSELTMHLEKYWKLITCHLCHATVVYSTNPSMLFDDVSTITVTLKMQLSRCGAFVVSRITFINILCTTLKVHWCRFENLPIYVEDFRLNHLLRFEICTRETCGKFVYKHSITIE